MRSNKRDQSPGAFFSRRQVKNENEMKNLILFYFFAFRFLVFLHFWSFEAIETIKIESMRSNDGVDKFSAKVDGYDMI